MLAIVMVAGCGDDEVPVAPLATGTIVISQSPGDLEGAGWSLAGPEDETGTGGVLLENMPIGLYTVTWSDVAGWDAPGAITRELAAGGLLTFTGTYLTDEVLVRILPGIYAMGSPAEEPGRGDDEVQHEVELTRGFYISKYLVTEQWWNSVMDGEPTTSRRPQTFVSFDMAVEFCNALSRREGLTPAYSIHGPDGDVTWNQAADGYRLPTEAEWEYACRAGSTTAFANGPITHFYCEPQDVNLDAMGWYCGNRAYDEGPAEVSHKQPNAWDLYDMHGNVWEWVWDGYRADYENLAPVDPVHNVGSGANRVVRGGNWFYAARFCRSADRSSGAPGYDLYYYGLRPVRSDLSPVAGSGSWQRSTENGGR
jgi:formylglycine-generating enzyme required for sulfatase activity